LLDPRKKPRAVGSEDCLYLDVYRPALGPGQEPPEGGVAWQALPVLVYIHGGGFKAGDPPEGDTYHFWKLAEDLGQVVVSLEYRLGALGFLALEELRTEAGGLGNFGLQDQQLALSWVQKNILAFGGDPDRVTIFGESAGAMSICAHVGSPRTKGLFARAIVQSGNCESPLVFAPPARALGGGQALREAVGCGGLGSAVATRE
jgi:para-nitrobenzyl esterase